MEYGASGLVSKTNYFSERSSFFFNILYSFGHQEARDGVREPVILLRRSGRHS